MHTANLLFCLDSMLFYAGEHHDDTSDDDDITKKRQCKSKSSLHKLYIYRYT